MPLGNQTLPDVDLDTWVKDVKKLANNVPFGAKEFVKSELAVGKSGLNREIKKVEKKLVSKLEHWGTKEAKKFKNLKFLKKK